MTRKTRRSNGPISAAWLGAPIKVSWEMDRQVPKSAWHTCPGCKCQRLATEPGLCMSCDPEYVQIQPGVFTKRPVSPDEDEWGPDSATQRLERGPR
jgi:hypothetical protein